MVKLVDYYSRKLSINALCPLAHIVYIIAHNLFVSDVYNVKRLCRVKDIVDNCGLSSMWLNQSMIDTNQATQSIHTRIK